jgi:hypothetical protein
MQKKKTNSQDKNVPEVLKTLTIILIAVAFFLSGCYFIYRGCAGNIKGVHHIQLIDSFYRDGKKHFVFRCRELDYNDTFPKVRIIKSKH